MKKHSVGQILYLIADSTASILPIQVVEEVITTTIDGKNKTYTVLLPDKKETKTDIDNINGSLFETKKAIRDYMISNATSAIDKMIEDASILSEKMFNIIDNNEDLNIKDKILDSKKKPDEKNSIVQNENKTDIIKVDLGNGKFANMKPDQLEQLRG